MKKILIINPFGIGDVLFTTPVIDALKKEFPDSFIGYLVNRKAAAILKNNPGVDELFFYTRGDLKQIRKESYWKYLKELISAIIDISSKKFDLAIDLSMVNQYAFLLWLIGVRQRWGFNYKGRGYFLTHAVDLDGFKDKHVVDYYRDLLLHFGIDAFKSELKFITSVEDRKYADGFFKKHNIQDDDLLVGIAPFGGASWGADAKNKQWPNEKFINLIRDLLNRPELKIILFGTEENKAEAKVFEQEFDKKKVISAIGQTSLAQLAAIISRCKLFIGNDSGPLHIACAQGIKTISLFGPVDEAVYGPIGEKLKNQVITAKIKCRPCYKKFKKPYCQTMDCLKNIDEKTVLKAVDMALTGS